MILLDTNIVIWMLRGKLEVIKIVDKMSQSDKTALSVITIAEVYQNIFLGEINDTENYIDTNEVIEVNRRIAKEAGLYWNQYHKKLQTLSITDCLIAATAKYYNCSLLTLNTRHFPMTDIKVQNPLK
jgi:predicted nucleic acid-binding protein